MQQQNKAYLYAFSAVLLWSTVATAFKIALQYVDFMQLLLFSSGIATLVMLVILSIEGKLKKAFQISANEIYKSAFRGALNPFLYYLILFKAYDILPAQEAMTLNYTWPIMLILLSVPLLHQKLSKVGVLSIILSFVGVLLIASKGNLANLQLTNLYGDLLALSTSIVWALFWIVNIKSAIDESIKLFYSFLFGFLFTLPVVFFFSSFSIPPLAGIASVIYIGMAEMGITFFFWLNALKLSRRTDQVSQLIYLSPFLSLIFLGIFLHEVIQFTTVYGLIFILLGIFLNNWYQRRHQKG